MRATAERTSDSRRTCVVTGVEDDPAAMLRFALSPEGAVTPDILRKLPGRGVWTRLDREIVARAIAKRAFARGFRKPVTVAPDLAELVDRLLTRDALDFLSLVNKAGLAITGAAKVEGAIRAGRVVALLHASDGARDGAEKLDRLLRGVSGERSGTIARINLFASSQMDLAFGRTNVIHAALNAGSVSAAFLVKVFRLVRYRAGEAAVASVEADAEPGFASPFDA
ncbi:MAG: RNA-binding protein [Roseiarcus sp.]